MRPVSRTADAASKYMQKLFEQYQKDDRLGHAEGNIVRSISPTIGMKSFMMFYVAHFLEIFSVQQKLSFFISFNVTYYLTLYVMLFCS